jgi:hypothetical protein
MRGSILYTRYKYQLASPTLPEKANAQLRRFAYGSLTEQDKTSLTYRITCTEKIVAKALLGIRGLEKVSITGLARWKESSPKSSSTP